MCAVNPVCKLYSRTVLGLKISTLPSHPFFCSDPKGINISQIQMTLFIILCYILICACVFFFCTAVLSRGTKGIPQSSIGFRMNVGKLESRMICRRLEKDGMIKVRPRLLIHCYIIFRPFLPPNQICIC